MGHAGAIISGGKGTAVCTFPIFSHDDCFPTRKRFLLRVAHVLCTVVSHLKNYLAMPNLSHVCMMLASAFAAAYLVAP
jgi:hypothetical protein